MNKKKQPSEHYDFACALIASAISPLVVIFWLGQPRIAFWGLFWFLISNIGAVFVIRLVLSLLKPTILSLHDKSAKTQ